MTSILAGARATDYVVGSNLGGKGVAAPWTLLVPSGARDAAVVVGRIGDRERSAMEGQFSLVAAIADDVSAVPRLDELLGSHRLNAVRVAADSDPERRVEEAILRRAADRRTTPPLVYRDCRNRQTGPDRVAGDESVRLLVRGLYGEPRVVVPAAHEDTVSWLKQAGWLTGRPVSLSRPKAALRTLLARAKERLPDHAHLSGPSAASLETPPTYVREVAEAEGVRLDTARWALVAPGQYATQKVLLLLFEHGAGEPDTVVKLAPGKGHPERLMTEAATLHRLEALDIAGARVPRIRFAGQASGRAVVGEEWIDGRAFATAIAADGPHEELEAATAWLRSLAAATAARRPAGDMAAALADLLDRFLAIHDLGEGHRRFLLDQVERVRRQAGELPAVVQHGDPGTWNLLVDGAGRVVFLDWESAEEAGIPGWDLWYLQRAYGAVASQRAGRRRIDASAHHLLADTPLARRFAQQVAAYRHAVQLPGEMLEPLFHLCWMHRALKESTRRTTRTLSSGHFRRLLEHLIDHRDAPGLRLLLGANDP